MIKMKYEYIAEVEEFLNQKRRDKSKYTIKSYEDALCKFFDFKGITSFEDIRKVTPKDGGCFQDFILSKIKDKSNLKEVRQKKNSANSYVRPLNVAFNFWVEQEYLAKNPFSKVKLLKLGDTIRPYLTLEEVAKIFASCKKLEHRVMLTLMMWTGIRSGELRKIQLDDIGDDHILIHGKGDTIDEVPLCPEDMVLIKEFALLRIKKYGYDLPNLFVSKVKTSYSCQALIDIVRKVLKDAGISEERVKLLHPHSIRHTFSSNLSETGADIRMIQEGLRHKNMSTTLNVYSHIRHSATDKAVLHMRSEIGKMISNNSGE
jgi:site-specific recombinase XerD